MQKKICLDVSVSHAHLIDAKALRNKAGAGGLASDFRWGLHTSSWHILASNAANYNDLHFNMDGF